MTDYDSVRYASLAGRNVLITGGASGIGAEMVKAFASQGSMVSFIDIDEQAGAMTAASTGAEFIVCDVTDITALGSVIARVEDKRGPVAVLVNNAARDDRHAMADVEAEAWR